VRLLLDTHAFIWWDSEPAKLSPHAQALCSDLSNQLLLSVASVWEMQVKLQLGKLHLPSSLADIIEHQQRTNGVEVLPVTLTHVLTLEKLPTPHRDPFDRMLLAQAMAENLPLVSRDSVFQYYPVRVEW
jgi:PIN domain nuclease of toxin-antitoxin system